MDIELSEVRSQRSEVRFSVLCLLFSVFCFVAGCENASSRLSLTEQVNALREEKTLLARQIEQSEAENEQLKRQLKVLADLPGEVRLENLYRLQRIKITRYTNLYDKDKDGTRETLIVYIQPIDEYGDIVKATGSVDIQLWDLNKEAGQALLGQWHIEPDELKKLWFATLITINYRLTFEISEEIADAKEPLTVKATFTDYLTGRVFTEQRAIKLR